MRYFLYRIKKQDFDKLANLADINIDYTPEKITSEDKIIVFVSETLKVVGTYKRVDDNLIAEKLSTNDITLKDFYDKLSIVTEITPRTYKLFAKKVKEIEKRDYDLIVGKF